MDKTSPKRAIWPFNKMSTTKVSLIYCGMISCGFVLSEFPSVDTGLSGSGRSG